MKIKPLLLLEVATFAAALAFNIATSVSKDGLDVSLANVEALSRDESVDQGSLYGNAQGTYFCCCPGSNSCGSAACGSC